MANIATLISTIDTLNVSLQYAIEKNELKKWVSSSELGDLSHSMELIKGALHDGGLNEDQREVFVKKLGNVVYDADDLFDVFLTLAETKQVVKGGNICAKVRNLFCFDKSHNNPAYKLSSNIKEIKKTLDEMFDKNDKAQILGFRVEYQPEPIIRRREETISYVYGDDVIGREDDLDMIVRRLLDSIASEKDVGCLPIVGIGGLGKTALAQLVYNDDRVCSYFALRLWVCVANLDAKRFDVIDILNRIVESLMDPRSDEFIFDMQGMYIRERLRRKRFFLVLDDVRDVFEDQWLNLMGFLSTGERGSMILVTTRSRVTADIVRTHPVYELQPLSEEKSWLLFKKAAFETYDNYNGNADLIQIGREIVEKCAGNPLAIKVVGSLLYGQNESKWLSIQETGLANSGENGSTGVVVQILKLSYDQLEFPLKSCFSYLALFPKDVVIYKDMLINLWMAQGYIVPFENSQSIRDAGEEYFSILLAKSFFQDIIIDQNSKVVSCKVQSLMHDLAREVAGSEFCATNAITDIIPRHLYHGGGECTADPSTISKIRSYLQLQSTSVHSFPLDTVTASCIHLRALDLHSSEIEHLPDSLGNLLQLRYLDLSKNVNLKALPSSLTKLFNLQTLNIDGCYGLKVLPEDFSKLVNLQHFYVDWDGLTYMPPDMDKLTRLYVLTCFVVADNNSSEKQRVGQLKDLRPLSRLEGCINISIPENCALAVEVDDDSRRILSDKAYLTAIWINFQGSSYDMDIHHGRDVNHKALLKMLRPHPNLKGLTLCGYQGANMSVWDRGDNLASFLPNLVKIELRSCHGFQHLPPMSELQHLKSLELRNLRNLKYLESLSSSSSPAPASEAGSWTAEQIFFPSLVQLELVNLPKLKGWWRGIESVEAKSVEAESVDSSNNRQPPFPCLSKLTVQSCLDLASLPPCPSLETLFLSEFNENLRIIVGKDHDGSTSASSSYPSVVQCGNSDVKLKRVEVEDVDYKSKPMGSSTGMHNDWDKEFMSLPEAGEVRR